MNFQETSDFLKKNGEQGVRRAWRFRLLKLAAAIVLALLWARPVVAANLTVLAPKPDWSELDLYQKTITRADFLRLLQTVYAPEGAWRSCIELKGDRAEVRGPDSSKPDFVLKFAKDAESALPVPRYWSPPGSRAVKDAGKPLAGYTIALDPGHLGGRWAKMEERWFQIGEGKPVAEGDMVMEVAKRLEARLAEKGAAVVYVRGSAGPVTHLRPQHLKTVARAELKRRGVTDIRDTYDGPADPLKQTSVQWQSELLFYRVSEIRERAKVVNEELKPDLAICLHFNAEDWGNPAEPSLVEKNHLHLLVNGCYSPGELAYEDIRREMLLKLLSRSGRVEIPLSKEVANSLAAATGLPAFEYKSGKARAVTDGPYVWARNLLANRLYRCPVVYCEPYVMNSKDFYERIQLGEYEGTRAINGVERKSVFNEYADAVADGVVRYFERKN